MRVVQKGKPPVWKARVTCKSCKARLEAEAPDVFYEEWSDMGGEDNHAYFVRCPECGDHGGTKVFLKEADVPFPIRKAAEARYRAR